MATAPNNRTRPSATTDTVRAGRAPSHSERLTSYDVDGLTVLIDAYEGLLGPADASGLYAGITLTDHAAQWNPGLDG